MSSFHENIPEPSTGRKVLKVTTAGQTYEEVQEESATAARAHCGGWPRRRLAARAAHM